MKNKAKMNQCLVGLFIMLTVFSCKSIIEEDITGKQVSINAPTAPTLEEYNQVFWWNEMEGITQYEVQLVSKSFTDIQKLVFDTLVTGTKFTYTLSPGEYEWRIRGVNGNYKSDYSGSKFTMLVSDIKKQYVELSTPGNLSSTNANPLVLSWVSLYGTSEYRIEIDKSGSFSPGMMDVDFTQPGTNYTLVAPIETTYYWRVIAYNSDGDSSKWSSVNSFTYDITPPDKVVLTSPANNLIDANTETGSLKWTDLGANTKYIVYVQYGSASETQSSPVSTTSYSYTATDGQTVKWRVQAVDAAGNKGVISDQWSFKIQ